MVTRDVLLVTKPPSLHRTITTPETGPTSDPSLPSTKPPSPTQPADIMQCGYGPEKPPNPRKRRRKPVITPVSQQSMNVAGPSHAGHPTPTMVAGMEMVSPATSASAPSTGVGSRLPFDPNEGPQIDWISTQTQKRLMVDP